MNRKIETESKESLNHGSDNVMAGMVVSTPLNDQGTVLNESVVSTPLNDREIQDTLVASTDPRSLSEVEVTAQGGEDE